MTGWALLLAACGATPAPAAPPPTDRPRDVPPPLVLPRLGPSRQPAPVSLESFLDDGGLTRLPFSSFRDAASRIVGARVRWRLSSWGGEVSEVGFETPSGREPSSIGRVRFVSAGLPGANLQVVVDAGHPVVTCLARFSPDVFVRSDERAEPAPGPGREVMVEGTVWGATAESGMPTLWLADCAVLSEPAVSGALRSGLHHLPHVDAMSLELDLAAARFRWGVNGCDYSHAVRGALRVDGGGLVLEGPLTWPEGASFANPVDRVRVEPGRIAGSLRATGVVRGTPFEQVWLAGGVCADCGGGLGPTGQHACDDPYLGR